MAEQPFTEEDVQLVAQALWDVVRKDRSGAGRHPTESCFEDARAALEVLARAGRLDARGVITYTGDEVHQLITERDALRALVEAGRLLPPGAKLTEEYGVRVDRVHPKRPKKETLGHVMTHFGKEKSLLAPTVWDGWTTVKRSTIKWVGPWVEVLTDPKDNTDE